MSGVCLKVAVGASGGGGGRVLYDTRQIATRGEHERVWTQNVPEYVDRGDEVSFKERRADLAEFVRQLEEDELSKSKDPSDEKKGKDRTFYRLIYAFHEDPGDEKIKEMVSEHQREALPQAYIINAIHRNSGHVHVHSVVAARQKDGTKLHLDWREYRTLDEKWAKIYGREFGERFEREHLEKKRERLEHRRAARAAIGRGERPPPRPERVTHQRNQLEEKIQIVQRERSITRADERGTTGRERRAAARTGADEGRSRDRVRGAARGGRGPESRSLHAEGRAGAERESAPPAPEHAEHAERDAAQFARVIRGEGGSPARKTPRRRGEGSRGGRTVAGGGGPVEGRAGGARIEDRGFGGQARHAAEAASHTEQVDRGPQGQVDGGRQAERPQGRENHPTGEPDHQTRPGASVGGREQAVDPGRDVRTANRESGLLAGAGGGSERAVVPDLVNQLDNKLADALSGFTRALEQEREREEQYREANRAPGATADRAEDRTPGAPERGAPEPGRAAPDVQDRDAPTMDFFDR